MVELLTGHSLWDYITVLFDNIPKIMYFIYAALASCLDLLQCVMRKLAGLDTYWVNGSAVVQQDPVIEFIYGILGLGQNAGAYSTLNVVFWSLTIFGAIVLIISTFIAIVKSHYGEDANKTNPLTHIYTAIKAIFTFAITPVAVILGIYLSQFMLQTLDNITSGGAATVEHIEGVYGKNIDAITKQGNNKDKETYSRYDFFGYGSPSSGQTFSGMMFRAAAYGANRVRTEQYNWQKLRDCDVSANRLFGDTTYKDSDMDDQEWIAYQIDYAFMNNFYIKGGIWAAQLYSVVNVSRMVDGHWVEGILAETADLTLTIASMDFFQLAGYSPGFSKYNVGLVWYYYNLWKFNFFVGFASIVVSFGLLVSIIIGLMSRLIKSAVLFLIFPGFLGLAPLDDWNSFKGWRKEFISQILMAFGAIISMNLFFLVLPFVNEISWFGKGFWLLDYIMNSVIIVVGLLTIKSFTQFVSGLIGAADALATGEGMKKELKETAVKAGRLTMGAGNIAAKGGFMLYKRALKNHRADKAEKQVADLRAEDASEDARMASVLPSDETRAQRISDATTDMKTKMADLITTGRNKDGLEFDKSTEKAMLDENARRDGVRKGTKAYKQMELEARQAFLTRTDEDYRNNLAVVGNEGYTDDELKTKKEFETNKTARQNRIDQIIGDNFLNEKGNVDQQTSKAIGRQVMKELMGAVLKGMKEGSGDLGLDVGSLHNVFQAANNNKYDKDGNVTGSYQSNAQRTNKTVRERISDTWHGVKDFASTATSARTRLPGKSQGAEEKIGEAAKSIDQSSTAITQAAQALLKAAEKLNRYSRK